MLIVKFFNHRKTTQKVADLIPENILILPLRSANKGDLGAFIVTRTLPFSDVDKSVLKHLASVYGHALAAHNNTPLWVRFRERLSGAANGILAAAALLVSLIPMRLTAVAPAEIAVAEPFIVAALRGVVDRILVKPNEKVKKGTPLCKWLMLELKSTPEWQNGPFALPKRNYFSAAACLFQSR